MNTDIEIRRHLVNFLKGGHAHMTVLDAVKDFPLDKINTVFPNGTYSSWDLLEHIRRTQNDVLEFITKPDYKEREWPKDYWPLKNEKATKKEWEKTIKGFIDDVAVLEKIIMDKKTSLQSKVPSGTGQTIIREILLIIDHTAYHIGEFAIMRQAMNTWGKNHK